MKKKEMYDWLTEKRDLLLVKQEKMIKELFDFDRLPKRKQDISNQLMKKNMELYKKEAQISLLTELLKELQSWPENLHHQGMDFEESLKSGAKRSGRSLYTYLSDANIRVKDFTAFCSHPDDMKCEVDLKVFVYHSKLKAYSFETTRIIMSYYTFRTQYSDCTVRYFEKTTDGMYYYLVSMVK